jgi:hypothetical protein
VDYQGPTGVLTIAALVLALAALLASPAHARPPALHGSGPQSIDAELETWTAPPREVRTAVEGSFDGSGAPIDFSAPAALGLAALATVALRARHRRMIAVS